MREYRLTVIGLVAAAVLYLITLFAGLDLFESVTDTLASFEEYEVDELVVPVLIVFFFAFADLVRWRKSRRIESEKTKIYEAMMFSTHHILNNFLNQVQLLKITAEDTPGFDRDVLSLYEQAITDATFQIEALGSIANIDESSIHSSVTAHPSTSARTQSSARDTSQ